VLLKPPEAGSVGSLDDADFAIGRCQQGSRPLDNLGIQEGSRGTRRSVGKPGIDITHMGHILEHGLVLQTEEPLADQHVDHRSPSMDVTDVRAVVQVPNIMRLSAGSYLDPCVFRLWMNVQQQPTGA